MKSPCPQGNVLKLLPSGSLILVLFMVLAGVSPQLSSAQDALRIGLTVGGASKFGVVLESFLNGNQSLELTVGTWSFKEISTSLVIKRYFRSNDLDSGWYKPIHPFIGAGLWVVGAKPPAERLGLASVQSFQSASIGAFLLIQTRHAITGLVQWDIMPSE